MQTLRDSRIRQLNSTSNQKYKAPYDLLFEKEVTSFEELFKEFDMTLLEFVNATDKNATAEENEKRRNNRAQYVVKIMYSLIEDFLNFKNRKESMNSDQINRTAKIILKAHKELTLQDLRLYHYFLVTMRYGKVYDLDGQVFIDAMRSYWEERAIEYGNYVSRLLAQLEREKELRWQKELEEHPEKYIGMPESTKKVFEEFKKQLTKEKYNLSEEEMAQINELNGRSAS